MSKENGLIWGFCGYEDVLSSLKREKYFIVSKGEKSNLDINKVFKRNYKIGLVEVNDIDKSEGPDFERFVIMYSRHFVSFKRSHNFYLKSYKYYKAFFSSILEKQKIEFVVFSNIPHEGPDFVLANVAKKKGLRVVTLYQSIFYGLSFYSENLNYFKKKRFKYGDDFVSDDYFEEVIDDSVQKIGNWGYMDSVKNNSSLNFRQIVKNSKRFYSKKNHLKNLKILFDQVIYSLTYKRFFKDTFSFSNEEFIYFPLHLQPELTTSALGGDYTCQLKAIAKLSNSFPHYKIYVKENPKQNSYSREDSFYLKLSKMDNVVFVPSNISTISLINNCKFVATITGTCAWEAINLEKSVVYFGDAWYRNLPGVFEYKDNLKVDDIISFDINKNLIKSGLKNFLKENTVHFEVDIAYFIDRDDEWKLRNAQKILKFVKTYEESIN